ncbi:MAG: hypothetical protein V4819_18930 [Verrucomicrobiota bacterium]
MMPTAGWYPVKLSEEAGGEISLIWQDLSEADFAAPFFEDAVRRARHERPGQRKTSLQALSEILLPAAVPPAAFIFHTSRSGSTLLTQLLSGLEGGIALSEPAIVDEILQLRTSDEEKIGFLRNTVRVLGQGRSTADRYFFIKHDSWHLPWLPMIREAFPSVPCFFVYRDPVEILWSHHRQRGSQMVPGLLDPALFDITRDSFNPADLDGFAARVLESIFAQSRAAATLGKQPCQHIGGGVQTSLAKLPDKTVQLAFPTVAGRWYRVRYTSDLEHWTDCQVPVLATSNSTLWIDSGPPYTVETPANTPVRFYLVHEIEAP